MVPDLRSAIHQLKRHPSFVIGATLSLAIGMSVATAVFSIVESTLLRPLPFPESGDLVSIVETVPALSADYAFVDPRYVIALRDQSRSLENVAIFSRGKATVGESGEARSTQLARVTPMFFTTLRVRPVIGHPFDTRTQSINRTVIISHALWSTRFGQSPDIIGSAIRVDGDPHTIVGVMPHGFNYPFAARLWLALNESTIEREALTGSNPFPMYHVVARLASGVTLAQSDAEANVIHRRLATEGRRTSRGTRAMSFADFLTRSFRDQLRLWGVAALLIVILCAVNFATMSLARGMRRRAEIAVRVTLGASSARIVRLLVAEATVMSLAAGAAAVLLGWWMLTYADALFAEGALPIITDIRWPTVAFGVLATAIVGFLFAVAPAIELAKVDLRSALTSASSTTTMRSGEMRGRRALVALQLSLALTAVAVVTSIVQADALYLARDAGIDYSPVVMADVRAADPKVHSLPIAALIDRLRAMPGAGSVAVIGQGNMVVAWREERLAEGFRAITKDVSPEFFDAAGLQLLAGRLPSEEEVATRADVVVAARSGVDRTTAQEMVGKRIRIKPPGRESRWMTITGVVPSIGTWSLGTLASTFYTVGHQQSTVPTTLVVRAETSAEAFAHAMSKALTSVEATMRIADTRTASALVSSERRASHGRAVFLTGIAALAMLLALVGVYGLTSYSTELRARELAVRTALGARTGHLIRLVFAEMWWMAAIGVVVAVVASGRLTAFLDAMFRNPMVSTPFISLDPVATAMAALALVAIMAAGTVVPLRRVLRLDVIRSVTGSQ